MLESATFYSQLGYAIFPCVPGDKKPLTASGFHDATTDEGQLRTWWNASPAANIGLPTDGLIVIDLDGDHHGWADLFASETCPVQITPRGGRHFVFRKPDSLAALRCSANKLEHKVDVRTDGGYICVSPSLVNGNAYRWLTPLGPRDELPFPPAWLIAKLEETLRPPAAAAPEFIPAQTDADIERRAIAYLASMPPAISGQGGHNATYAAAAALVNGFALPADVAYGLLWAHYNPRCDPPWSDREIWHKVNDAANKSHDRPRAYLRDAQREVINSANLPPVDLSAITNDKPADRDNAPRFTKLIDSRELLSLDLRQNFLVPGVLVANQPAVIGGRSKTLKTSIALDLAVSLASGTPFLSTFPSQLQRVAVWSGESGAATIRETALRIAESKGVDLATSPILWGFDLPKLGHAGHIADLEKVIVDRGIQTAFVDPLYLSLMTLDTASQASNVYAMGALLLPVAELGQRTGCTIVVLHHAKRTGQNDDNEPASLEVLSQAGIVEWARQWIILQRRTPYAADGRHELWMRTGGSAGHAGLWAIDVDEGFLDPEIMSGRHWAVDVRSVGDAMAETKRAADQRKIDRAEQRDDEDKRKMLDALRKLSEPQTKHGLRELTGLNNDRSAKALSTLIGEGRAKMVSIVKNKRTENGYEAIAI